MPVLPPPGRRPIDAALAYAARGWPVFPCHHPTSDGTCSCDQLDCSSPAKHPRVTGGFKAGTTDPVQIDRWWRRWPHANIGLVTGAASGLIVLDIDPRHGGDETLTRLERRHGDLPATRVVATGSGGRHLYFAHPGTTIRNSAGRLGPGLDIRGDGGYVVAPPSVHATGGIYRVTADVAHLPCGPKWVIARAMPPIAAIAHRADGAEPSGVVELVDSVAQAGEGQRNDALYRAVCELRRTRTLSGLDALKLAARSAGLTEQEIERTVASGLSSGRLSRSRSQASGEENLRVCVQRTVRASRFRQADAQPHPREIANCLGDSEDPAEIGSRYPPLPPSIG